MYKRRTVMFLGIISIVLLAGIAFGTGLILKVGSRDIGNDPLFYKSLGNELLKRGEHNKAIMAYESALKLEEDIDCRNNLAILYYARAEYDKAILHLRALLSLEPSNPSFHYDLAVNLVDKFRNTEDKSISDLQEALKEYRTAEMLSPGYEHAMENIAVLEKVLSGI